MQDQPHTSRKKTIIFIILGFLLVVGVAVGTAYTLSQLTEPASETNQPETPEEALVRELTTAYEVGGGDKGAEVTFETPDVQPGGTEGYKNAKARIADGEPNDRLTAYFYQAPEGSWKFFAETKDQDTLECALYTTDELINAYIGFTCQENNEPSFVQRPEPVFEVFPDSIGE